MLPTSTLGPWFVLVRFSGRCTCSQHDFAPSGNVKAHSHESEGNSSCFGQTWSERHTFQLDCQLNCHIRVSRIHHGQTVRPACPESCEPSALCAAKPKTSQDQRQSSCVTDPFIALIDRDCRIEHRHTSLRHEIWRTAPRVMVAKLSTSTSPGPERNGPARATQTGRQAPTESAQEGQHVWQWSSSDRLRQNLGGPTVSPRS